MRVSGFSVWVAASLLAAAAVAPIVAKQAAQPAPDAQAPAAQSSGVGQSDYVLKIKTRLVTLDVIARDSRGNVVRDLKPEELQIFERKAPQKIAGFEFVDRTANDAAPIVPASETPAVYSNLVHFEGLRIPPTILLMDALNTPLEDQLRARTEMVRLIDSLPPNTPIAVFLLGNTLRLVQGFTSDPGVLRAAVNRLVHPDALEKNPLDDPNGASREILADNGNFETQITMDIEDFEKEEYANTVDVRAHITLDTLKQVARYFSGISGRKNLIWLSESFPMSIDADLDNGTSFEGIRNYGPEVEAATSALNDAQVAIYPIDLRTLQADQSLSASQDVQPRTMGGGLGGRGAGGTIMNGGRGAAASRNQQGAGLPVTLDREDTARVETEQTMDKLAVETGGQTCENQNALAECIMTALNDSSSYYELAFYPQGTKWDGKFHQLTVKTSRRGVTLTYRRGYFAQDSEALARQEDPDGRLREACADLLPSTAIHLIAQPMADDSPSPHATGQKFLLVIDPLGLDFQQNGDQHHVNIQAAVCEFDGSSDSFRINKQDLSKTISNDTFQAWQAHGIPDYLTVTPNANVRKVRLAVLDTTSGLTGALDIPLGPDGTAPVPIPAAGPAAIKTTAALIIPDNPSAQPVSDRLTLHGESGQEGTLAWTGNTLVYQGALPVEEGAPAFFSYAFGSALRCESGALVSRNAGDEPKLQLIFWNNAGQTVTVNLKGAEPEYSGDLSVDPLAKGFLAQVWRISHCLSK